MSYDIYAPNAAHGVSDNVLRPPEPQIVPPSDFASSDTWPHQRSPPTSLMVDDASHRLAAQADARTGSLQDETHQPFQSPFSAQQLPFDPTAPIEYSAQDNVTSHPGYNGAAVASPESLHAPVDIPTKGGSSADSLNPARSSSTSPRSGSSETRTMPSYPWVATNTRYELGANIPTKPWDFRKFQAKKWLKAYAGFSRVTRHRGDLSASALRVMRIHVMMDTIEAFTRLENPKCNDFRMIVECTRGLGSEFRSLDDVRVALSSVSNSLPATFSEHDLLQRLVILNADSLDAGSSCSGFGYNTCVLNMGNPLHRGGGFVTGAAAQEESLFRRSNLYYRLADIKDAKALEGFTVKGSESAAINQLRTASRASGPFMSYDDTIYTPQVIVSRHSEADGYGWLSKPMALDVLTACALDRKQQRDLPYSPLEESQMGDIIESVLLRAVTEGKDCIILGAFGCGAFNNPPLQVATIFRKKLIDEGFARFFRLVVFAIIEDGNSAGKNMASFNSALGVPSRGLSELKSFVKAQKKKK